MNKVVLLLLLLGSFLFAHSQPRGLEPGSKAPNFIAMDQSGNAVQLSELIAKGPVVIFFYRGQWCPYCNKQLKQLEDSLGMLTVKGASVIAVSPEIQENIEKTVEKTKASFPVLHDKGLAIMRAYDVAFEVEAPVIEKYKKYGIDFNKANGSNGAVLPVPAVYIIKNGIITYRFFDTDYTRRASIKDLAAML